jgi:hypothetical protein
MLPRAALTLYEAVRMKNIGARENGVLATGRDLARDRAPARAVADGKLGKGRAPPPPAGKSGGGSAEATAEVTVKRGQPSIRVHLKLECKTPTFPGKRLPNSPNRNAARAPRVHAHNVLVLLPLELRLDALEAQARA